MSIVSTELILRAAATNNDTASNGGRMSPIAIVSGVKNNVWPDVPQAERTSGSTKYRKVFWHIANDDDLAMVRPRCFVETPSPGDDSVMFFPGTQTNTQTSITGSERCYGAGLLNAGASAGATSLQVLTEKASYNVFRSGDIVRVSNKATVDDTGGTEEYVTVSGSPSYVGDVATIVFTPALQHSYLATVTKVSSVYELASCSGTVSGWTETGSGTYNEGSYPVKVDSIGGIQQTWTLTFTSASSFSVVGDTLGLVGTGNVSSNLQPTNADFAKPYFVMEAAGWGGSWTTGNTVVFTTNPASIPLWEKRVIPAGANSLSGDKVVMGLDGESA